MWLTWQEWACVGLFVGSALWLWRAIRPRYKHRGW
jgi:hypothetical protein